MVVQLPIQSTFKGIATSVARAWESVEVEVKSIVANIISMIKQALMYVYEFLLRFWSWAAENPKAFITILANWWVLMM